MKRLLPVFLCLLPLPLPAQDWVPIDARSRGAGNAGVALADEGTAAYWNPSLLAKGADNLLDFTGGLGISAFFYSDVSVEGDILSDADRISDLFSDLDFAGLQARLNAGTAAPADLQNALKIVEAVLALDDRGRGALGHVGGGVDFRYGPFGFFARELGSVGVDPFIDFSAAGSAFTSTSLTTFFDQFTEGTLSAAGAALRDRLTASGLTGDSDLDGTDDADELAYQSQTALGDAAISSPAFVAALCAIAQATQANAGGSDAATLLYNGSGVEIRSLRRRETGVSFGLPVLPVLNAGITLKEIITDSYYTKMTLREIGDGTDLVERVFKEYDRNHKRSDDFNVDLGVSASPLPGLTLGLAARNVVPMTIDSAGPEDIRLDPQFRFGASFAPIDNVRVGADIDLRENGSDLVKGYRSRMAGAGVEAGISILRLRSGFFDNLASSRSGGVFTAGAGLKALFCTIDADMQMSRRRTEIEAPSSANGLPKVEVPARTGFSVTAGVNLPF